MIGEVGIEVVYARDGLEEVAGVTTLGEPAGVGTALLFVRVRLAVLCARSLLTSWSSCGSMEFTYISSKRICECGLLTNPLDLDRGNS